jgi:hypothetical protein
MSRWKRVAIVCAFAALLPLALYAWRVALLLAELNAIRPGPFPATMDGGPQPVCDHFVGHTKASIVEQFGQPSHEWEGHYGLPSLAYRWKHPGAVTLTYVCPKGALYLSFCRHGRDWVCFSSDWMPEGLVCD